MNEIFNICRIGEAFASSRNNLNTMFGEVFTSSIFIIIASTFVLTDYNVCHKDIK